MNVFLHLVPTFSPLHRSGKGSIVHGRALGSSQTSREGSKSTLDVRVLLGMASYSYLASFPGSHLAFLRWPRRTLRQHETFAPRAPRLCAASVLHRSTCVPRRGARTPRVLRVRAVERSGSAYTYAYNTTTYCIPYGGVTRASTLLTS